MQTENNYDKDTYNGDIGLISTINREEQEVTIDFYGNKIVYDYDDLDQITLAYATTIHKSQGSEYALSVAVLSEVERKGFLNKQLVYTAITRARYDYKVFASKAGVFEAACKMPVLRASGLAARLR